MVNKHFQETRAETIKSFAWILKATALNDTGWMGRLNQGW